MTYDELNDKSLRQRVKDWTDGKVNVLRLMNICTRSLNGRDAAHSPHAQLREWPGHHRYGSFPRTGRASCFIRCDVEEAAFNTHITIHLPEFDVPWILAK